MTDRTIYQLERAMDALSSAIKYLKEDMQPYHYSISKELVKNDEVVYDFYYDYTEKNINL